MRQTRWIPGLLWVVLLTVLGIAAFIAIILGRGPDDSWASVLAPAAQTLLAAVVAAFGVSQILIARQSVSVTQEQNAIMRTQLEQAEKDSAHRASEAEFVQLSAHRERLDSQAPKGSVSVIESSFSFESANGRGAINHLPVIPREAGETLVTLRVSVKLANSDRHTLQFRASTSRESVKPSEEWGTMPEGNRQLVFTETKSMDEWRTVVPTWYSQEERIARPSPSYAELRVDLYGPSRFVHDTHVLEVLGLGFLFDEPSDLYHLMGPERDEPLAKATRHYSEVDTPGIRSA